MIKTCIRKIIWSMADLLQILLPGRKSRIPRRVLCLLLIPLILVHCLSAFPAEMFKPNIASAISECDKFAVDRGSYFADNQYCTCSTGSVADQPVANLSGATGPIFVLGDSITVMAANKYKTELGKRGVPVEVDASGSGSITGAGNTGSKTSGLQAVQNKKDFIKTAGTIIIALGTNGNNGTTEINKLLDSVRAINPNIRIYWVDTYVLGNSSYNNKLLGTIKDSNKAIYENEKPKNYQIISWAKKVAGDSYDPIGMPSPQPDQNDFLSSNSDGIHPNGKGLDALVKLVDEKLGDNKPGVTQPPAAVTSTETSKNSLSVIDTLTGTQEAQAQAAGVKYIAVGDIPAEGREYTSTIYGGDFSGGQWKPNNKIQGGGNDDNGMGADGKPLPGRTAYAELSNNPGALDFSAMGKLPMGTKLEITYNGKSVIAIKADVGAGGAAKNPKKAIDLWWETARLLDFKEGTGVVKVRGVDPSTPVTPIDGSAAAANPTAGAAAPGAVCCPVGSVPIQPLATTQSINGDTQELAKQMLANKNIVYWTNNGINTENVVKALAEGKKGPVNAANATVKEADVNPNILKFILEAAQKGKVMVNAITDKTHSNGSKHYSGEALDLDLNTAVSTAELIAIAKKYNGTKNSEADHHHFDFPMSGKITSTKKPGLFAAVADILTGNASAQTTPPTVVNNRNAWAFAPIDNPDSVTVEGSVPSERAWSTSKVLVIMAFLKTAKNGDPSKLSSEEAGWIGKALSESNMDALRAVRGLISGDKSQAMTDILRSIGDQTTPSPPVPNEGTMTWSIREQVKFMAALANGKVVSPEASKYVLERMKPVPDQSWGLGKVGATAVKGGWLRQNTETRQMGILNGYAVAIITAGDGAAVPQSDGDSAHVDQMNKLATSLATRLGAAAPSQNQPTTSCAPCPTNPSGATATLVGADNEEKVYRYLVSVGWSPAQAAGIVGNMTRESGVNPKRLEGYYKRDIEPAEALTIYGPGQLRGYGLVQWTPIRKLIDSVGVDKAGDMAVQLQFLTDQMDGKTNYPEKKAGEMLKKETTPEGAAVSFMKYYERPGVLATGERVAAAKRIFDKFSGAAASGVGTGSGAASTSAAPAGCSGNGSTVVVDGYAFPIGAPKKTDIVLMPCKRATCHHDGTPASDLYHKNGDKEKQISKGWPVYAIQDGVIKNFKTSYNNIGGCPTWQLQSTDGWMYWYGHTDTPSIKEGDTVKAGQQIAVIGDNKCTGNGSAAHLHIDRGSPKGRSGGSPSARDPELIPILNKLWEALPQ